MPAAAAPMVSAKPTSTPTLAAALWPPRTKFLTKYTLGQFRARSLGRRERCAALAKRLARNDENRHQAGRHLVDLRNRDAVGLDVPAIAAAQDVEPHHRMHEADHRGSLKCSAVAIEHVGHERPTALPPRRELQLLQDGTVLEVNRDVTAQRQVEASLHESELRSRWLASIVESSDDAIVSKNLDGIITSWNASAERVFGYSAVEALGQPITIVIPQDRRHEEPEILTLIRRGERVDHFETIRQRKDGTLITVSLTISPVRNAKGEIVGASKIARDITEQKRNQERIGTLAREAEHRSKNMLANVQAVVNLSEAETLDDFKKAIKGRINALAHVHSLFAETRWIGAELSAIAKQELSPFVAGSESRVAIDGPEVLLAPDTAQAVAICLHELATNAVKYGSLSVGTGQVDLTWSHQTDGTSCLRWVETGGPDVKEPTRRGFGSRVIEQMIAQLKGKTRFDWRTQGLICEIILKV
jgi:PAS domain S-box-containing protein